MNFLWNGVVCVKYIGPKRKEKQKNIATLAATDKQTKRIRQETNSPPQKKYPESKKYC